MSRRRTSLRADVQDLDAMLRRLGAANPEVAALLYPQTFEVMMHPFTPLVKERCPEYMQLLTNIAAKEKVRRLSGMDADEKLIDLGITAAAKEAEAKAEKGKKGGEEAKN